MIRLHRLNGQEVVVNAELIETVEGHAGYGHRVGHRKPFCREESVADVIQQSRRVSEDSVCRGGICP